MTGRVVLHELLDHIEAHGTNTEDSEKFEGDHGRVRNSPTRVSERVLFPLGRSQHLRTAARLKTYTSEP